MQGYYVHYKGRIPVGVSKKIDMSLGELRKYSKVDEIDLTPEKSNVVRSLAGFLPLVDIKRDYNKAYRMFEIIPPDYLYIRRTTADKGFLNFLRVVKDKYPKCRIVLEVMSYPYDKEEFRNLVYWPYYFKEILNRRKYNRFVDRIVTFSDDKKIFGIETIKTVNGISVDNIVPLKATNNANSEVNLICVAGMYKFHGYERLIEGLNEYYCGEKNVRVIAHMVGDGPELEYYKKLVYQYKLNEYVVFYGKCVGDKLDDIYEGMDIAISSLGLYKLGIDKISSLKVGEYLSKGIPVVVGCDAVAFSGKEFKYFIQFPNDDTPINIAEVVKFYKRVYDNSSRDEIIKEIRTFAKENVDYSVTMYPIIKYLLEDCKSEA